MITTRAILHDERVFEDPEEYRPDRYLKDGQLNLSVRQPEVSTFGFGRRYTSFLGSFYYFQRSSLDIYRMCPGRFLSDNTLFSILASTLHSFDIAPALDEKGVPIPLSTERLSGLLT